MKKKILGIEFEISTPRSGKQLVNGVPLADLQQSCCILSSGNSGQHGTCTPHMCMDDKQCEGCAACRWRNNKSQPGDRERIQEVLKKKLP